MTPIDPVASPRGIDLAGAGECDYWPAGGSEVAPHELASLPVYEKE